MIKQVSFFSYGIFFLHDIEIFFPDTRLKNYRSTIQFNSICVLFSSHVDADVSHLLKPDMVTDTCLGCICEASSGEIIKNLLQSDFKNSFFIFLGCDQSLRCAGDVCGLFR